MLKDAIGFGEIKKILGVNSRTLSDKLKMLQNHGYIKRNVTAGPPLRVEYALTSKGKNTVLLALPLAVLFKFSLNLWFRLGFSESFEADSLFLSQFQKPCMSKFSLSP